MHCEYFNPQHEEYTEEENKPEYLGEELNFPPELEQQEIE